MVTRNISFAVGDQSVMFRLLAWYGLHGHHRGQWRVHSALRKLLHVEVDGDFQVERQGLKWVLNPSDYPQGDLFWLGVADRWDLYHARLLLRPGAVVLDVGANFGYYSVMLGRALEGNCEIHAFEPAAESYRRLTRHIALNGIRCIRAHRLALGESPGWASLHRRAGNSGASYLETAGNDVLVSTVDQFATRAALERVDFIKIDVEGFEERVLRGGMQTLSRFRPALLVELQPITLERAGSSVPRLLELLRAQGYKLYQAERDRLKPLEVCDRVGWVVNVFCIHEQEQCPARFT